jgi:hypothetical protein
MPDKVKGKKISDFGYWIDLESDFGNATIIAFKHPESEMKTVSAEASLTEAKAGGQYKKESEGNVWDAIVVTPEYGALPIDTWKSKTGQQKIQYAIQGATGAAAPTVSGTISVPQGSFYSCKECGSPIVFAPANGLCPSCGKKFTV